MARHIQGCIASLNRDSLGNQFASILPYSHKNLSFIQFLFKRGWIRHYYIGMNGRKRVIFLFYKYSTHRNAFIRLKMLSGSGTRYYCTCRKLQYLCRYDRQGSYHILRTSRGYLSSEEALSVGIGGELICRVFSQVANHTINVAGCLSYSLYNVNTFPCYSESTYFYCNGALGTSKYKYDYSFHFLIRDNSFSLYDSMSSKVTGNKLFRSLPSRSLRSVSFGFFSKYRIKGLGHRIYLNRNNFLFKIGYSHSVYKLLDSNLSNMRKRFKKEVYFAIRGLDIVNSRRSLFIIQSHRIPNCYCFNGVSIHGLPVDAKEGKKGFMSQFMNRNILLRSWLTANEFLHGVPPRRGEKKKKEHEVSMLESKWM
jgi:ribosomal protein S8/ribosomal protein L6P/L9E